MYSVMGGNARASWLMVGARPHTGFYGMNSFPWDAHINDQY